MSVLVTASGFAQDHAPGGFRDQALAALVYTARQVLDGPRDDAASVAFAKRVIRGAAEFADIAAWSAASDPTVFSKPPGTTADVWEPILVTAIATAWPLLTHLDNYNG